MTYFGSSNNKRPMHWRELNIPCSSEDPLSRDESMTLDDLVEQLNGGYPYQLIQQNDTVKLEE